MRISGIPPINSPKRCLIILGGFRLFDLKKRKDVGSLSQHQGSISKAVFAGSSHLLTAGEDGRIAIFRSKDWECLHVLRHKKPINSLAVHPSGKLALSVGTDRSMKLWNLMTAKEASKTILPKEVLSIVFSESGDYFATLSKDNDILLYRTDGAKCIGHVKSKARLICITFLRDEALYYAGEGSKIGRVDVPDSIIDDDLTDSVKIFDSGCTPRVKDMAILYGSGMDILIAGTSSGLIKAINLKDQETLFEHKSGLRITCLTASLQ